MPIDEAGLPARLDAADGRPKDTTWGLFGPDDQLGTLNFLTDERVRDAAALVRTGRRINLNLPLDEPFRDNQAGTRKAYEHHHTPTVAPSGAVDPTSTDELLSNLNTQYSTQWDGLGHVRHPRLGHYRGLSHEDVRPGPAGALSIGAWARAGGIVARGVLIDLPTYAAATGLDYTPGQRLVVGPDLIEKILAWQHTDIRAGDVLFLRTGSLPARRAGQDMAACAGFGPGREIGAFVWRHRVAAIASDSPSTEASPIDPTGPRSVHMQLIPMMGMPIGELFDLEELAADCAATGTYDFMLVSMPLNLPGGIASPANAVAIR